MPVLGLTALTGARTLWSLPHELSQAASGPICPIPRPKLPLPTTCLCRLPPALAPLPPPHPNLSQVEAHPYHRNDALLAWCRERGVHLTAYSPLGSPDSESIFPRKRPLRLLEDPALGEVAGRLGKDVGQVG